MKKFKMKGISPDIVPEITEREKASTVWGHPIRKFFVENVVEWQHLHSFACGAVDIFLNGNKGHAQEWIDDLRQSAGFYLFSAEAVQVFHNNGADLSTLYHLLHPLKIVSGKAGAGDTIIYEKHGVSVAVPLGIVT